MPNRSGFTLIELLVTISIIAILSTIGMVVYGQITMSARDARRKLDLQSIAQALEVYYQKNNNYPPASAWIISNTNAWNQGFGLVPNYISSLPLDPKNTGNPYPGDANSYGSYGYGYAYWSYTVARADCSSVPPGQFYMLMTRLENLSDPDRLQVKDYKWCDGTSLWNVQHWPADLYIITPK